MGQFRFLTAGESHGKGLTMVIEGVPSGLPLSEADIAPDLARRQGGYGRGGRMKIEQDHAEIMAGVRHGLTRSRSGCRIATGSTGPKKWPSSPSRRRSNG